MLEVKKFVFGPFSENTFLVYDSESKDALVIDPGNMDPYENTTISSYIQDNSLHLKYIVVTHSHIDHILGINYIRSVFNVRFFAPEKDMPLLLNAQTQGQMFDIETDQPPHPDQYIDEGTEIEVGIYKGTFLFTPGHTPGEHCLYFKDQKLLFSGDVLFNESIGRTDLWGGNTDDLLYSINNKLFNLPEDVVVYPGHGDATTIGHEKKFNPFLRS
jgi:hydroxyacylglutathione hydrolase